MDLANKNSTSGSNGRTAFSDLDSVPWAQSAITRLSLLNVVVGDNQGQYNPNRTFKPKEPVTRAQIAVILSQVEQHLDTHSNQLMSDKIVSVTEEEIEFVK